MRLPLADFEPNGEDLFTARWCLHVLLTGKERVTCETARRDVVGPEPVLGTAALSTTSSQGAQKREGRD